MCYFCCVSILHLTTIRLYAEGFNTYFPRVLRGGIFIWNHMQLYTESSHGMYSEIRRLWSRDEAAYADVAPPKKNFLL